MHASVTYAYAQRTHKGPHCKKRFEIFPSSAWMSLTELSLSGNNLIFPGQGEFGWGREKRYPFFTVQSIRLSLQIFSITFKVSKKAKI